MKTPAHSGESAIAVATCEACRTRFICYDDDTHDPCYHCGTPLHVVRVEPDTRWDWPELWQRACVAASARKDGHASSVGMPADAVLYLMKRACVKVNP